MLDLHVAKDGFPAAFQTMGARALPVGVGFGRGLSRVLTLCDQVGSSSDVEARDQHTAARPKMGSSSSSSTVLSL